MNQAERIRRFDDYLAQQRGRLVAIARVYAGNDSEDLLQEILLQIWKSLDQFRDLARLDTWAYRIAINTSLQWRRSASRKQKHLPPENVDILFGCYPKTRIGSGPSETARLRHFVGREQRAPAMP